MLYDERERLTETGKRIDSEIDEFVAMLIQKHPDIPIRQLTHVVIDCATRAERKVVIARGLHARNKK